MNSFKIIPEETFGFVKIEENSQFNNIKAERVVIGENVTARLFGSVNDIVLKRGARLFFHGTILGNVKNKGGELVVFSE
jgi:hypothetical protein